MLKRILCLALCMVLSFSVVIVGKCADNKVLYETEEYIALFEAMQVMPESFENGDALVSRGEFLTFLISLMNFNLATDTKSSFDDVQDGTPLAFALKIAVSLGIVADADNFYPNEIILYPQAVKMVIAALGYGAEANYKGGYPNGFMSVARRLKINVAYPQEQLNVHGAINLLGQMCETYVNNMTGVSIDDGDTNLVMTQGELFLYHYHDIYRVSGVVGASEVSFLNDSTDSLSPLLVQINGVDYVLAEGVECPLGYYASAFVRENSSASDTVIYASLTQNKVTMITSEQDPHLGSGALEYVSLNGKDERLKYDRYYSVLYNGKAFENCTASDFSISSGEIYAIDNNLDGSIDVFSIRVPEYVVVDYVDPFNEIIYDENYVNNIILGGNDIIYTSDTSIKNIKSGDTIGVFKSKDEKYVELFTLKNKVNGMLEGYTSDRKIVINGVSYEMTDYFKSYYSKLITLGTEISVVIGNDNKCVALKEYESGTRYGYLDSLYTKSGLDDVYRARIFSETGELEFLDVADKVRFNDDVKKKDEAYSLLSGIVGKLIRYKKDAVGNLNFVNTVSGELGLYIPSEDGVNALKRYDFTGYDTTTKISYKKFGYFVPYFNIDSSTKIFCVAESETDIDYKYSMGNGIAFLPNDARVESNKIEAYNVDEAGRAEVIVYKTDAYSATLDETSAIGIVSRFNASLDVEGNKCYKIELYASDRFNTYYIEEDSKLITLGSSTFAVGDFIKYEVSPSGYITNIDKVYDNATKTLLGSTTDNTKEHYYYGDIHFVGDGSIALKRAGGDVIYLPVTLGDVGYISDSGIATMPKNIIKTYKHMGANCSKALVKCYYSQPQAVYIYE